MISEETENFLAERLLRDIAEYLLQKWMNDRFDTGHYMESYSIVEFIRRRFKYEPEYNETQR